MGKKTEWTIYCHTHRESGRRYVGLTKQTWRRRWNSHAYNAFKRNDGTHFANAIRKYGKDAFDHEVLEACGTLEAANAAEKRWIDHFDTTDPKKGFNLARGGSYVPNPDRKNPWDDPGYLWNDPDYRKAHGEKMRAVAARPAVKAKREAALREFISGPDGDRWREKLRQANLGRPLTEEHRAKISEAHTGMRRSPEHVANYVKTRRTIDDEKCAQRTSFSCGTHGEIPLDRCESYVYKGRRRYRCRACRTRRRHARRATP